MRKAHVFGAALIGTLAAMVALGAVYEQFSPGGALSGTWNSQNVNVAAGGSFITGTLPAGNGGTGQTSATDDSTLIGNGTTFVATNVNNCADALTYSTSTNSFGCNTAAAASSGTFTATYTTGFTTQPTQTWAWTKVGNIVTLWPTQPVTGTSNATTWLTNAGDMPAAIRPTSTAFAATTDWILTDNGVNLVGGVFVRSDGGIRICGRATFTTACSLAGAFTASGTKGMSNETILTAIVYSTTR